MTRIASDPVGRWWLDDGRDSGVWPCEVIGPGAFPGYVHVRTTLEAGPYFGDESLYVPVSRVYDSDFNRPTFTACVGSS